MRAKDDKMSWYFDIVNPVLAELCRRYGVKVYTAGNMIQSKGNMPHSCGTSWRSSPR
jgi:hypothetical protein